ncbi:hypothetical protein CC79DRAFT_1338579 [Sarocladium strictum]
MQRIMPDLTPRQGRSAARSRRGCSNRKRSHLRCDELNPFCNRCTRLRLDCQYVQPRKSHIAIAQARPVRQLVPLPKTDDSESGRGHHKTHPDAPGQNSGKISKTGLSDDVLQTLHMSLLENENLALL